MGWIVFGMFLLLVLILVLAAQGMLGLWSWSIARDDADAGPACDWPPMGDAATFQHPDMPAQRQPRYEVEPRGA